ncbi:amphi-Trp domain-containing protein [Streptomyces sp. H39-S7]|uniref:amphi-Trp domain-containing protein n=1 Tax=Streptomyces sp. H39-S7 TaxID=3004357 RepID=UPI0022AEF9A6|nr:amphi-Trp domain-containing protein [Streptomyces sp. H39-S7]MCZ4125159.1 amphi-Trp domain-containing protein [Streptomyces sp. H39-S7]
MSELKFEQKRSLSRGEAADQLTALADALRKGGDVEMEFGHGTLSLTVPDGLRSEIEIEVDDGEIELEIELTWPTGKPARTAPTRAAAPERSRASAKRGAGTAKSRSVKKPTKKTP